MAISSQLGSSALLPAGLGFRNLLINADFRINQRGYASGGSLAQNAYGFDRWKAQIVGTTTLTFTSAPQGQMVTINANQGVRQIIERANVTSGTYILSWEGTVGGRVYSEGGSPGGYASSPVTVMLDGTANVIVEFITQPGVTSTLWKPQLERNLQPTPFEQRPIGVELSLCQRYYQVAGGSASSFTVAGYGYADPAGTAFTATFQLITEMRTAPTIGLFGAPQGFDITVQRTITAITSTKSTTRVASGDPSYTGGTFNAIRTVYYLASGVGTPYGYTFSAEL